MTILNASSLTGMTLLVVPLGIYFIIGPMRGAFPLVEILSSTVVSSSLELQSVSKSLIIDVSSQDISTKVEYVQGLCLGGVVFRAVMVRGVKGPFYARLLRCLQTKVPRHLEGSKGA
jgi:hypothetical protein